MHLLWGEPGSRLGAQACPLSRGLGNSGPRLLRRTLRPPVLWGLSSRVGEGQTEGACPRGKQLTPSALVVTPQNSAARPAKRGPGLRKRHREK